MTQSLFPGNPFFDLKLHYPCGFPGDVFQSFQQRKSQKSCSSSIDPVPKWQSAAGADIINLFHFDLFFGRHPATFAGSFSQQ